MPVTVRLHLNIQMQPLEKWLLEYNAYYHERLSFFQGSKHVAVWLHD